MYDIAIAISEVLQVLIADWQLACLVFCGLNTLSATAPWRRWRQQAAQVSVDYLNAAVYAAIF